MKNNTIRNLITTVALFTASIVTATASAESSVWKVTKGSDHIYIGGTVHILPVSEFPLPEEFVTAYRNTDTIVLETKLPDAADQNFQARLMQKMAYTDGKTLSSVLTKQTYQSLSNYLAPAGIDLKQLDGFKPGLIVTMMTGLEAQRAQISGDGVDAYFSQLAKKDKKTPEYLETVDFQLDMLANMGLKDEESLIKSSLSQMNDFKAIFSQLISAWRSGNDKQLTKLVIDEMKEQDPETFKTMMIDRNQNWIPHIEQMFNDDDKEFVLVGVGHLVGDKSVINLLEEKGYQISKL